MKKPWNAVPCKEKKTSAADSARLRKPNITNLPCNKEENVTEYDVFRWISEHFSTEMEDLELEKEAYKRKPSNSKCVNPLKESYKFNTKTRFDLEFNSPFIVTKQLPAKKSEHAKKCTSKKIFYSKPESGEIENLVSAATIKPKTYKPKYVSNCNTEIKSINKNETQRLPITDYRSILEKENFDVTKRKETKKNMYKSLGLEKSIQANSCKQFDRDHSNVFNSKFIKMKLPDSFGTRTSLSTDSRKNFESDNSYLTNRKKKRVKSRSAPKQKSPNLVPDLIKPKIINLPRCKSAGVFTSSWKANNSKIQVRREQNVDKGRNITRKNNESLFSPLTRKKENKVPCKIDSWVNPCKSDAAFKNTYTSKSNMTTFQATLLRAAYRVAARQMQLQQNQVEHEMANGDYKMAATTSSMHDRIRDVCLKRGAPIAKADVRYWEE